MVSIHCRLRALAICLAMIFLMGCTKEDPIVTYTVPKHELIQIPVETPKDSAPTMPPKSAQRESKPAVRSRMLAALVLDKEVAWFYKGMAPVEDFSDNAPEKFDELIKSTKYEDPNNPTWELGEDWKELPGSGMRYANLMLGGKVVFSVIKLAMRESDREKYTMDNVNRWRGQLDLPPIKFAELEENARKLMTADQHDAVVVDIEGMPSASAMGPMAGGAAPRTTVKRETPSSTGPAAEALPVEEKTSVPFVGSVPESWSAQDLRMFQLASYKVAHGEDTANVSVSKAGGSLLMNVNRWRGQVGLDGYDAESDIEKEDITIGEKPGLLTEMKGAGGESIVVAIVPEGQRAWFFKLMGKTAAVEKETEAFKQYLETIEFK